ncbi:hypothetical protein M405DRAFT_802792 [Rhizopogon salebrosus TDB-379]|jgi:hypothetical protein|nr:hypothetical protein M405DRAFT_802792 [Rhizopogon salebrosus TDB-379]
MHPSLLTGLKGSRLSRIITVPPLHLIVVLLEPSMPRKIQGAPQFPELNSQNLLRTLTRSMDTILSEDEETAARLRQRWKFDQDDEPLLDRERRRARSCPDR